MTNKSKSSLLPKHPFDAAAYERDLRASRFRDMTSIFANTFSADGRYLLSASNFGVVTVWDLAMTISTGMSKCPASSSYDSEFEATVSADNDGVLFAFTACEQIIYTMVFCGNWLVIGTSGGAMGWRWSEILASKGKDLSSQTIFSGIHMDAAPYETNQLAFCHGTSSLYEAAGDGRAYVIDLERQTRVGVFEGHSDYLHCIQVRRGGHPVTGSEDGTVRLWDARTRQTTNVLTYHVTEGCNKNKKTWVASLAIDRNDDWLVCAGGGIPVTMYHLRSTDTATCAFPQPDTGRSTVNTVHYSDGNILCGGDDSVLYTHGMDGTVKRKTRVAAESIYSISINDNDSRAIPNTAIGRGVSLAEDSASAGACTKGLVAVSGVSPDIDVLTSLGVRTSRLPGAALS